MILKTATSLAFAAVCLTAIGSMPAGAAMAGGDQLVTNGPQTSTGDESSSWSARQNVIQSERYDRMLEQSAAFRQTRMRKECGPITDRELRASCLASFNQGEPAAGSSTPPHRYRSSSGR